MSTLAIGPVIERVEFQIPAAELIANTAQEIFCPVDGFINDMDVVVNVANTSAGTITLQGGGAVWTLLNYLDTTSAPFAPQGATLILPSVLTFTPTLFNNTAPTTPGIVQFNNHGLVPGQPVTLGGTLPTGFSAGTYFVSANGFSANAFNLSSTAANAFAGVAITASGSASTTATVTTGAQGIIPVTNQVVTVAAAAPVGTLYASTPVPAGDVTAPVKRGQLLKLVLAGFATAGEVSGLIRFRSNR